MERAEAAALAAEETPQDPATEAPTDPGKPAEDEKTGDTPAAEEPEPTEPAAADGEPKEKESKRWEALARTEQKLLRDRQRMKRDKEEWDRQRAQMQPVVQAIQRIHGGDPLGGLKALGIDYRELTKQALKDPGATRQTPPEANGEIKQLREQLASLTNRIETQRAEQTVRSYHQQVATHINADTSDRWETLKTVPNFPEEVLQLIQLEHQNTGVVITPEQAADRFEKYLVEDTKRRFSATKLRKLLGGDANGSAPTAPNANGKQAAEPKPNGNGKAKPTTVTNADAAEPGERKAYGETEDECRSRALAMLESMDG
jgi:hypothetical protein